MLSLPSNLPHSRQGLACLKAPGPSRDMPEVRLTGQALHHTGCRHKLASMDLASLEMYWLILKCTGCPPWSRFWPRCGS